MKRATQWKVVLGLGGMLTAIISGFGIWLLGGLATGAIDGTGPAWPVAMLGLGLLLIGPATLAWMVWRARKRAEHDREASADPAPAGEPGPAANRPDVHRGRQAPRDAEIVAEMPPGLWAGVLALALALGGAMVYTGLFPASVFPRAELGWVRWVLLLLGGLLTLGILGRRAARPVYFAASPAGVYFRNEQHSSWFLVPWTNVRALRETRVPAGQGGSTRALSFELCLSPEQVERWFQRWRVPLGSDPEPDRFRIAFGGIGVDCDRNLPRLRALRARAIRDASG